MSDSNKPRICDVLGVEVGEEWTAILGGYTYRINASGRREMKGSDGLWHVTDIEAGLADIINHPENIIHKRRWSKDDIEDTKAIRRLYPNSKFVRRVKMTDGTFRIDIVRENGMATWLAVDLVSSLEAGEKVALDEILEAIPAADVAPVVHGAWIRDPDTGDCMVRCSRCREVYDCDLSTTEFAQFYHYCPNCGAKMDRTGFKAKEFAEAIGPAVLQGLLDGLKAGQE